MSNTSLGIVFTSSWMEVWKIENDSINKESIKNDVSIRDSEGLYSNLSRTLVNLGMSGDMKYEMFGVFIPDRLKKALVCGITKDGSLKAAEKLAKSLLYAPAVFYTDGDLSDIVKENECDAVIIGGGFDDSDDEKVEKLIHNVGESEWFKKNRPTVIYAGNRESISTAQLKFSPFSDFYEMSNVLEDSTSDNDIDSMMNLDKSNHFTHNIEDGIFEKIQQCTYLESIHNISKHLCSSSSGRVISVMINDSYSVLNQYRVDSGKPVIENKALPKLSSELCPDDFSQSYKELSFEDNSGLEDIFFAEDILQIGRKKHDSYFRPDRIVGISLSEEVDMTKFLDLISDPDIVRGIVKFFFDRSGFFLMCGSILNAGVEKATEKTEKLIDEHELSSGWLVIPDGDFIKDEKALEVYISGEESDNVSQLFWGKRYVIPVKEGSTVELRFKGSAFLVGRSDVITLRVGNRPQELVIDIRKEKS